MKSNQNEENRTTPVEVSNGVRLLYLTLFLGIFSIISGASNLDSITAQYPTFSPISYYALIFSSFAIMIFFIHKIGKGRNWARITLLISLILGLPFSFFALPNLLRTSLISGVINIIQMILQIIALVFLFQKASSDWFKSMKKKSGKEQQEEETYKQEYIKEKARLQAQKEFNEHKKK